MPDVYDVLTTPRVYDVLATDTYQIALKGDSMRKRLAAAKATASKVETASQE